MDWNSLYDKINQAGQFGKGVGEGAYAGGKSLVQGVAALPGLAKRAVVAVGDGVYQTATDPAYREQVFDGVAQLASGTKDFAAAIYRDPIGMTSAGYEAVSAKVKMARDAYGKASAAAEQQGRLPEFLGQIGGRGLFEVGVLFVPISKLSVLGKAGVVLKDGKAVTNLARASEGATLVTDSVKAVKAAEGAETIKPAAAALEASAQYAKREIGIVAKCSEVAPVIVPHGFASAEAFAEFGNSVRTGLGRAGYTDVEPILQGSAVTGKSFTTGEAFDVARTSDFDIALASPTLLARAKELGIGLRSLGTRTGPLSARDLALLGLRDLSKSLSEGAGRDVNFMIFDRATNHSESKATMV